MTFRMRAQSGFSMIDALMSIAVFALLTSGLIGAVAYAYQSSIANEQRIHAMHIAQEGIEAVRVLREDAWNGMTLTQSGVSSATGSWQWVGEGSEDSIGTYTRIITLDAVCRDSADAVAPCPALYIDIDTKKVSVEVRWAGQFGSSRSYTAQTLVTHWDTSAWTQTDWSSGDGQAVWSQADKYDTDDGYVDVTTTPGVVMVEEQTGCGLNTWDLSNAVEYLADAEISIDGGQAALVAHGSAPDSDTVALWHLNEDSGSLIDYSGQSNTLAVSGTPTYNTSGQFGSALSFGATTHYAAISDAAQTNLDFSGSFTVEAWIKKTVYSGSDTIVEKWGTLTADQSYQFFVTNTGAITFQVRNGNSAGISTSAAGVIALNTWYHVAGVYDGATVRVFVNGTQVASRAYTLGAANTTAAVTVSKIGTGSFNGVIDEVRISKVARYTSAFTVPTHPFGVYYDTTAPSVSTRVAYAPTAMTQWFAFSDETTLAATSAVRYQLSTDGTVWQYWNGVAWTAALTSADTNTAAEVHSHINGFSSTAKQIFWKAFLISEGSDASALSAVDITCDIDTTLDMSSAADYAVGAEVSISGGTAALVAHGSAPDSDTVGLWHLNEDSGSLVDYSGLNNTLVMTGVPTYNTTGAFGSAIVFGSSAHYASIPDASQSGLDFTGSFTIEAWINKTALGGTDIIADKWGATTDTQSYRLFVGNLGAVGFQLRNGPTTVTSLSSTGLITPGVWYHVAGVYDGATIKVYINGAQVATAPYTIGVANTVTQFSISKTGLNSFDGVIDEVRVSKVARYTSAFTVPTHPFGVYYDTTSPSVALVADIAPEHLSAFASFADTVSASGTSTVSYQVSTDAGVTWQYWNGSAWTQATLPTQSTSAATISAHIADLSASSGTFRFTAFLVSEGSDPVSLDTVTLGYVQATTIGFAPTATVVSSAFNLGGPANITSLRYTVQRDECGVCVAKVQLRVAPDVAGVPGAWSSWYGATGENTYFTEPYGNLVPQELNGNQWVQYAIILETTDSGSPLVEDITILYDLQ